VFSLSLLELRELQAIFTPVAKLKTRSSTPTVLTISETGNEIRFSCLIGTSICSHISTKVITACEHQVSAVPLEKFLEVIRTSNDDGMDISLLDDKLQVDIYSLSTVPPENIPETVYDYVGDYYLADLLSYVERVKYATSDDVARPNLNATYFLGNKVVACDGPRYHHVMLPFVLEDWSIPNSIYPLLSKYSKLFAESTSVISQSAGFVEYRNGMTQITFPRWIFKLPDFDKLIVVEAKKYNHHLMTCFVDEAIAALKKVALTSDKERPLVLVEVEATKMTFSASDNLGNSSKESISCTWTGALRPLSFPLKKFRRLVKASSSDKITLRFGPDVKSVKSPAVLWDDNQFAVLQQAGK